MPPSRNRVKTLILTIFEDFADQRTCLQEFDLVDFDPRANLEVWTDFERENLLFLLVCSNPNPCSEKNYKKICLNVKGRKSLL